jgi:hypothetical protein
LMPIMIFMTRYYHSSRLPGRIISVSHKLIHTFPLTLILLIAFLVSSCEEGPTQIGKGILPEGDFVTIKGTDTLSVRSYTMYDDSIRTDNPAIAYLGHIYDPYFGTTSAEFVTQLRLLPEWDDLPFTIDSVKLILHLLSAKGGGSDENNFLTLSEISQQIYTDSAYYSNKQVPLTGYEVNNIRLPVLRTDTINDIAIPLPVEFGNYLTRDTSQLFHSNSKPDFRSFFKGLYFRLSSGSDPLMVSLYLAQPDANSSDHSGSQNYIVLFMHDDADVQKEFYFVLDAVNKNAAYSRYIHNFSTASPGNRITHINDNYMDTLAYLQYLNGVYTRISLPGLESLKNDPSFMQNIGVNKARLIFPIYFDGNIYKPSTIPSQLLLRYKTTSGSKYIVPDYNIDTYHSFYDGTPDTVANVYNFNIATFVQGYLEDATGNVKPELELFQVSGTSNVILKANKSKTPSKFEFTYTKF